MPGRAATRTTRDAILAAALDLFASRGYEATTIDDVREASGASTGSIYHHFESKQGIAAALFVEGLAAYQREALEVYRAHPHAEPGVRALVRRYLAWMAENRPLARFLLTTREPEVRAATDPALEELNRQFYAAADDWRNANIAAGRLRPFPPEIYRAVVLGPAEAFARRWLAGRVETPLDEAMELLADAAWRAVRPAGAEDGRAPDRAGRPDSGEPPRPARTR